MADKQTPASRRLDGQKSTTEAVLAAADEVVAAAKAANSSLPRKSRQRIRKLTKDLDAARATVAERLQQAEDARRRS